MTNDLIPYYVAAPGMPSAPEPGEEVGDAWDVLKRLGWTDAEIRNLGSAAAIIAAAAAQQRPPGYVPPARQTIGSATRGYMEYNPETQAWEPVPGPWGAEGGGGGGGGAATGTWQWNADLGVFVNSLTGAAKTPEAMGIQVEEQPFTLSAGERLIERQPDGSLKDVTPGGGEGDWNIINRDDGLYGYKTNPDGTLQLQKLADLPMSEYDKQQLNLQREQLAAQTESDRQARALEAAKAGFPSVAFSEGGYQYQQVPVSEQMLAGEQPSAAFRRRAVGAPEGTPWEPVPAATGTAEELGPGAPLTEQKRLGLAQVFARGGYQPNTSPWWRLGAEGGGVSMGGGLGGTRPYRAQQLTVGQRAALRAEQEGAPALAGGPVTAATAAPATAGPVTVGQRVTQKTTAAPAAAPVESMAARQQRAVAEERRRRARRNMGITVGERMAAV